MTISSSASSYLSTLNSDLGNAYLLSEISGKGRIKSIKKFGLILSSVQPLVTAVGRL